MGLAHLGRVDFGAVKLDKSNDPVAVGLFGALGVMVVAQHLTNLIHQLQARIRFESRAFLIFHEY
jgi:hypothetical protein